jgi:hypothetical protein
VSAECVKDPAAAAALDIAEVRRCLCSAMADMGGIAERLRDLEEQDYPLPDCWEDIASWANQAQESLAEIALLAVNRSEAHQ